MSKEEKTIQKSDFYKVSIDAIVVEDGFNVRHELVDIDSLAQSIAKEGQINPVIGYKVRGEEKFVLTAGHRRLAAIKLANEKYGAGITHINLMAGKNDEKSRVVTMLLDGEASKSLTTEEMVLGIARLLALGVSNKEIMASIAIGESQAQKYNLIKAAKAPEPIQAMLKNGDISVAGVNKLQRETKSEEELVVKAQEAVEKAKQKGSTKATTGTAGKDKVSADVAKLEEALSLADPTTAKYAVLKAVVGKLKKKASAEEIAKLLK
jgi:ParB/RepB/Spo0J family partition protein